MKASEIKLELKENNICCVNGAEFFANEFSAYAMYDTYRNVASYIDGLKPSARKVLWCIEKNNINKPTIKVESLANKTADESEYMHGAVSLIDVCTGLAKSFAGTNNINLLKPQGSFGNRTIPAAAPARYIYTCKEKVFDEIFHADDKHNLVEQEFESVNIEPKFYVPTLPLILVNGSEGIGTGFAQTILPRNPKDIIREIKRTFEHKSGILNKIPPYFKGFNGTVAWNEEDKNWRISGKFERLNKTTILITEIPVDYSLAKYRRILEKLEDDKIIASFNDDSDKNTFLFEVKVSREFAAKPDEWIIDKLKLTTKVTENFCCIDENNAVREFKHEIEILFAYCAIRKEYYEKRKVYLLSKQNKELTVLNAKYHFVKLIVENKIKVFKKTKAEIEEQIRARKEFDGFEDLNVLLNLPIHSLSQDTIDNLARQLDDKKIEIKKTEETTVKQMWVADLNVIEKQLKDF